METPLPKKIQALYDNLLPKLPKKIQKPYDNLRNDQEALKDFKKFKPRYLEILKAINEYDSTQLGNGFKLILKDLLKDTDLGKHFERNTKSFFDKIADEGEEMVPPSEPADPAKYNFGTRTSNDSVNTEGLSKINNIKITKENKKMKISKQALTKLIKEELKEVLKEVFIGSDPKGGQGYSNDPDMQWWYEMQAQKQALAQKKAQRDEKMLELQSKLANIRKNKGLSNEELDKDPEAKKVMDQMEELLNQLKST